MGWRIGTTTMVGLGLSCSTLWASDPPAPGNILILMADDMGFEMVGAYGEPSAAITPELDALCQDGVMFRNAWSNPLCTPTRATIQTGRHCYRNSLGNVEWHDPLPLRLSEMTIPEMLDAGTGMAYQHALIGKWHLGMRPETGGLLSPNVAGYGHFAGAMSNFEGTETFECYPKVVDGVEVPGKTYATTDQVDDALAWITTATEPWFCFVNFHAPHSPFHVPPSHLLTQPTLDELSLAGPVDDDPRPYYRAMCEAMDTEIGRLRTSLGDVWDRTTVIFLGDNGTPGGLVAAAPVANNKAKGTMYRGGVNVPLIVSGPRVSQPGSQSDALVHTVDLFATIADLANVDLSATVPQGRILDSVSFLGSIEDPSATAARTTLFSEKFYPNGGGGPNPKKRKDWVQDLGSVGPGTAELEIEGNVVWAADQAEVVIQGAPPNKTALLARSLRMNPQPYAGGVLLPNPVIDWQGFRIDGAGELRFPLSLASTEWTVFAQMVIRDPTLPGGWALTNAVSLDVPFHLRTLRDDRYQVMTRTFGGSDEFYDLQTDPWQTNNLLVQEMSSEEQLRYDTLREKLESHVPETVLPVSRDETPEGPGFGTSQAPPTSPEGAGNVAGPIAGVSEAMDSVDQECLSLLVLTSLNRVPVFIPIQTVPSGIRPLEFIADRMDLLVGRDATVRVFQQRVGDRTWGLGPEIRFSAP